MSSSCCVKRFCDFLNLDWRVSMSVQVTLSVFSGRQNPAWTLSDEQETELQKRIDSLQQKTLQKPSGVFGRLGYRGFVIGGTADNSKGALNLYIHDRIVDQGQREENLIADNHDLEEWLLSTATVALPGVVKSSVMDTLRGGALDAEKFAKNRTEARACPACASTDAPPYNPSAWNIPTIQPYNNCYNYANNNPTNTFAQPGRAHGAMASTMACPDVATAAQADGLVSSAGFAAPLGPGQGWYVALVVWPGMDYHWYRQDHAGCWSHKPGSTAVRNVDNAGNPIADPAKCDRGPYTQFCGYMITKNGLVIS